MEKLRAKGKQKNYYSTTHRGQTETTRIDQKFGNQTRVGMPCGARVRVGEVCNCAVCVESRNNTTRG